MRAPIRPPAEEEYKKAWTKGHDEALLEAFKPPHLFDVDAHGTRNDSGGGGPVVDVDDVTALAKKLTENPAVFQAFDEEQRSAFPDVAGLENKISGAFDIDFIAASFEPRKLRLLARFADDGADGVAATGATISVGKNEGIFAMYKPSGGPAATNPKTAVTKNTFYFGELGGMHVLMPLAHKTRVFAWLSANVRGFKCSLLTSEKSHLLVESGRTAVTIPDFEKMCTTLDISSITVMRIGGKLPNAQGTLALWLEHAQLRRVIVDVGLRAVQFEEVEEDDDDESAVGSDEEGGSAPPPVRRVKHSLFALAAPPNEALHPNFMLTTYPQFHLLGDGGGNALLRVVPRNQNTTWSKTGVVRRPALPMVEAKTPNNATITVYKAVLYAETKRLLQDVRGSDTFENAHGVSTKLMNFVHRVACREQLLFADAGRFAGNRLEISLVVNGGEESADDAASFALLHALRTLACTFDFLDREEVSLGMLVTQYLLYRRLLETHVVELFGAPQPDHNTFPQTRAHADILTMFGAQGGVGNRIKKWVSRVVKDPATNEPVMLLDFKLPPPPAPAAPDDDDDGDGAIDMDAFLQMALEEDEEVLASANATTADDDGDGVNDMDAFLQMALEEDAEEMASANATSTAAAAAVADNDDDDDDGAIDMDAFLQMALEEDAEEMERNAPTSSSSTSAAASTGAAGVAAPVGAATGARRSTRKRRKPWRLRSGGRR